MALTIKFFLFCVSHCYGLRAQLDATFVLKVFVDVGGLVAIKSDGRGLVANTVFPLVNVACEHYFGNLGFAVKLDMVRPVGVSDGFSPGVSPVLSNEVLPLTDMSLLPWAISGVLPK